MSNLRDGYRKKRVSMDTPMFTDKVAPGTSHTRLSKSLEKGGPEDEANSFSFKVKGQHMLRCILENTSNYGPTVMKIRRGSELQGGKRCYCLP